MDFEKNVPTWNASGTEPPDTLKDSGFEPGYKPPAAFFNWFWHGVSVCLAEIRSKLKGHAENKDNPHGVTAAQLGLGKVNNTADSEKSVSYAGTSGTANQVKNDLIIRFNGGQAESTDKWTYNGSTSRSVNITPEKIDAAKKDLSNVDADAIKSAVAAAGVGGGIPIVDATSTDGVAYTATVDGITELTNGLTLIIIPEVSSTSQYITFNLNGLGAKNVRIPLSFNTMAMATPDADGFFGAGRTVWLQYDSGYGTAGVWKTVDKQRTSAQDLYGVTPVRSGGTGKESVTAGSFLVGNGTGAMVEKTPAEVLGILGLPAVTTADNGKFLRVVNGAWAAVEITDASGVSF